MDSSRPVRSLIQDTESGVTRRSCASSRAYRSSTGGTSWMTSADELRARSLMSASIDVSLLTSTAVELQDASRRARRAGADFTVRCNCGVQSYASCRRMPDELVHLQLKPDV